MKFNFSNNQFGADFLKADVIYGRKGEVETKRNYGTIVPENCLIYQNCFCFQNYVYTMFTHLQNTYRVRLYNEHINNT